MDCEACSEALTAHALGGRLPDGVRDHLRECASCRARLDEVQRTVREMDETLRAELAIEPSPAFAARIRQGVSAAGGTVAWWQGRWWPALVAGIAAGAVLIAVGLVRRLPPGAGPADQSGQLAARTDIPLPGSPARAASPVSTRPAHAAPDARLVAARPRTAPPREPEVIVPPGQRRAILRFVASLNAGLIDVPPALARSGEPPVPIEIAPVELVPIVIPPIAADESTERGKPPQERR